MNAYQSVVSYSNTLIPTCNLKQWVSLSSAYPLTREVKEQPEKVNCNGKKSQRIELMLWLIHYPSYDKRQKRIEHVEKKLQQ